MDKKYMDISKVLKELGLFMNEQTGGQLFDDTSGSVDYDPYECETTVNFDDGRQIVLLNGDLFLKSLKETENSFNIQFFVNA